MGTGVGESAELKKVVFGPAVEELVAEEITRTKKKVMILLETGDRVVCCTLHHVPYRAVSITYCHPEECDPEHGEVQPPADRTRHHSS